MPYSNTRSAKDLKHSNRSNTRSAKDAAKDIKPSDRYKTAKRTDAVIVRIHHERKPIMITLSVWQALFLREAVSRLSAGRAAWLWLLLEPVIHVTYVLVIYTAIRVRSVGGIEAAVWLMVGMLAFFMFRRTAAQVMNGINANRVLFTYRQVKPVDSVLVRAGLEGFLMILISMILFSGAALFGFAIIPADPLAVLEAFFGLWMVGLGFGLTTSVAIELVPEIGKLIGFILRPLYMISGVLLPIGSIPQPYRAYLLFNPIVHGLEAVRLGFSPRYHAVEELNILYLYGFAMVAIFLGLALHNRFATRLVMQ